MKEYDYTYRVLAESDNCLSTFQFLNMDAAVTKLCQLTKAGYNPSMFPVVHNTDPNRAEYEYRMFDIVILPETIHNGYNIPYQVGMVLCLQDAEPEFHGFRPSVEEALDYVDEYYYEKRKGE